MTTAQEPKKRGRPAAPKPAKREPINLEGFTIKYNGNTHLIYAGKSLIYATDNELDLHAYCRLIEQRKK